MRDGHECVVYDVNADSVQQLAGEGATGAESPEDFVAKLEQPRAVWVMIPAGLTGRIVDQFAALLDEGDIIIDGGNSNYRDDVRRAKKLREQGIHYVDIGTSGGVFGLERGYCLMVGGDDEAVEIIEPVLKTIAPGPRRDRSDARPERRPGARGAGLPALRSLRRRALREDGPQRHRVRHHGRLRRGPEHPRQRRRRHPADRALRGDRAAGGAGVLPVRHRHAEGRRGVAARLGDRLLAARPHRRRAAGQSRLWTVWPDGSRTPARVAGRSRRPSTSAFRLPVLAASLFERFASRGEDHFANQVLSAMRQQFGGHQELPAGDSLEAGGEKADRVEATGTER